MPAADKGVNAGNIQREVVYILGEVGLVKEKGDPFIDLPRPVPTGDGDSMEDMRATDFVPATTDERARWKRRLEVICVTEIADY